MEVEIEIVKSKKYTNSKAWALAFPEGFLERGWAFPSTLDFSFDFLNSKGLTLAEEEEGADFFFLLAPTWAGPSLFLLTPPVMIWK